MSEITKLLLLFGVGTVSSIINVNAGGGSSITLPALIFLGLESAAANGTNRIGILVQNIFAVSSFKQQKVHEFKESLSLSLFTLPGAVLGALVSVRINDVWFQRILGMVMIGIVFSMLFFSTKRNNEPSPSDKNRRWLIYPSMLVIGFYGGFIQTGVGFLLMASLYHLLRISLVRVNMHKVFIVLVYTLPALAVFIWTGNVHWEYGGILAAGTALGAWWGARIAVKGGERAIRYILAVAILLMAVKLLGLF
jgi:uncharacterized membrane protein YfcA